MQEAETITRTGASPTSQPLDIDTMVEQLDHNGSTPLTPREADDIFKRAEQELRPLLQTMRRQRLLYWLQDFVCLSLIVFAMAGMVWQCLTYPHTLVILYARTYPATLTATLAVPTRPLAPVTLTRSQTAPTTGRGHQSARAAIGILTFFNGNFSPHYIPLGTVFTGSDGVKIATSEAATVPAAQPPQFAQVQVAASASTTGSQANIAAGDINRALSGDLLVKNLTPFTGGRDARDFQAVAQADLDELTRTTAQRVTQATPQAFSLRAGERVYETSCATKTTADHALGDEARSVTVKVTTMCQGIAYSHMMLANKATAAFAKMRPGVQYHLIGSVATTIQSASPLIVTMRGQWAYTFTPVYEQELAEKIAGATPTEARKLLLHTGGIADASIPAKLPSDWSLIDLLVLVS